MTNNDTKRSKKRALGPSSPSSTRPLKRQKTNSGTKSPKASPSATKPRTGKFHKLFSINKFLFVKQLFLVKFRKVEWSDVDEEGKKARDFFRTDSEMIEFDEKRPHHPPKTIFQF